MDAMFTWISQSRFKTASRTPVRGRDDVGGGLGNARDVAANSRRDGRISGSTVPPGRNAPVVLQRSSLRTPYFVLVSRPPTPPASAAAMRS